MTCVVSVCLRTMGLFFCCSYVTVFFHNHGYVSDEDSVTDVLAKTDINSVIGVTRVNCFL